jgi:hypothetical protein
MRENKYVLILSYLYQAYICVCVCVCAYTQICMYTIHKCIRAHSYVILSNLALSVPAQKQRHSLAYTGLFDLILFCPFSHFQSHYCPTNPFSQSSWRHSNFWKFILNKFQLETVSLDTHELGTLSPLILLPSYHFSP